MCGLKTRAITGGKEVIRVTSDGLDLGISSSTVGTEYTLGYTNHQLVPLSSVGYGW